MTVVVSAEVQPVLAALDGTYLTRESRPRVSFVGGGFAGTIGVISLVSELTSLKQTGALPTGFTLDIDWYDQNNSFGRGGPYQKQERSEWDPIFILNQPASDMSPFVDQKDLFSIWLKQKHDLLANSFAPRPWYGDFLSGLLAQSEEQAASELNDVLKVNKRSVCVSPDQLLLDGESQKLHGILLSAGHQHSVRDAKHLRSAAGYIDTNLSVRPYYDALEQKGHGGTAVIIGGGASMMDAIRALEMLGFRGEYLIVSRNSHYFWTHPGEERLNLNEKKEILEAVNKSFSIIKKAKDLKSMRAIFRKLVKEQRDHFGHAAVPVCIYGADLSSLMTGKVKNPQALLNFTNDIVFLRGAPTPPENQRLFQELTVIGRIKDIPASANLNEARFEDNQFQVPVTRQFNFKHAKHTARYTVQGDFLVNVPSPSRVAAADLTRDFQRLNGGSIVDSAGAVSVLPYTTHGVESFRVDAVEKPKRILREILTRFKF